MKTSPGPILVWMRNSLRVNDSAILSQAARSGGDVLPFLCTSDGWSGAEDTPRRRMLRSSITALHGALRRKNSALFMLGEDPLREIPRAASALGAGALYVTRSVDPALRNLDRKLGSALREIGCAMCECDDAVIFGKDALRSASGSHYSVYTHYRNAWLARLQEAMPPAPAVVPPLSVLPRLRTCETLAGFRAVTRGGEPEALRALARFGRSGLREYHRLREMPAEEGTSRLSAHIACGAISARTVLSAALEARGKALRERNDPAARAGSGPGAFIGELIWREFFHQIMDHVPRVADEPYREEFSAFPWRRGTGAFGAWCEGTTGYPIVDAGMRQLRAEGWMHNRVRMIVASFLTKDLHIDWRRGEDHFFRWLVDADRASNNGNWQWVAGTGTDAAPYFRVFNPVLQGRKFDPGGAYVRRYLPELGRVPDPFIHAPWEMSAAQQKACSFRPGKDYPRPVVDHAEERQAALRMYREARLARGAARDFPAVAAKGDT